MRAIVQLTALDGGQIRWDGRPYGFEMCRHIGYLPEERGLYPTMRVAEQLRCPPSPAARSCTARPPAVDVVQHASISGLSAGSLVAAAATALAAVAALFFLPARALPVDPEPAAEREPSVLVA